jgi:acetyl esterase/lipase
MESIMKILKKGLILVFGFCLLLSESVYATEVSYVRDVIYGRKDGMALTYDVLKPKNANGAAIVFMMSGGWYSTWGDPETRAEQFADMLDAGFTMIPVYHGSAPLYKVPDAYSDVDLAVRHIKKNAENYAIDSDRIGLTGGSAGGHLSLMVGLNSDSGKTTSSNPVMQQGNEVATIVAYFPPVDFRSDQAEAQGIINEVEQVELMQRFPALDYDEAMIPMMSPITHVDNNDPPVLLIHGDADPLVNVTHSHAMIATLNQFDVPSELIVISGGKHGFSGENAKIANDERLAWFKKYLLQ